MSQDPAAFWTPLNSIMGTEANVRLLREMAVDIRRYHAPGELAARTRLTRAGAYRALERLHATGLVERGGAAATQYRLAYKHPLARPVVQLYRAEARRSKRVVAGLRNAIESLAPPPFSAWIEGKNPVGKDAPGDPLVVVLLDTPEMLAEHVEQLQESTVLLQREEDVTIEVNGGTRADLKAWLDTGRVDLVNSLLLFGVPPESFLPSDVKARRRGARTHQTLEKRGLAYARAVAEEIRRNPETVERARQWVDRRMKQASDPERNELREWDRILRSMSPARLARFLVEDSERAIRLRQSNPFLGVLTQRQRETIRKAISDDAE